MTTRSLSCAQCGKPMWNHRLPQGQATCRWCRRAARARVCATCGEPFAANLGHAANLYCSRVCSGLGRRGDNPKRGRVCEVCGITYDAGSMQQRTCGRACGQAIRGDTPRKPNFDKVYFPSCIECGVVFCCGSRNVKAKMVCSVDCRRKRNNRASRARYARRYHDDPEFRSASLARTHARRADKLGLGARRITLTYLGDRDGWRCGLCHRKVNPKGKGLRRPSIDHITPLSVGGTHELANVHISHLGCNLRKNNRGGGEQLLLVG